MEYRKLSSYKRKRNRKGSKVDYGTVVRVAYENLMEMIEKCVL